MDWIKKGLIFEANKQYDWLQSHAQLPVADIISDNVVRVYFASRNSNSFSSIGYVELDVKNNFKVLKTSEQPVLGPGKIGHFDEHGVFPASIVNFGSKKYLYFIGWNQGCKPPLFYSSIGLAVSEDSGKTFQKISEGPILSRGEFDPCLVTSPNVFIEDGLWKMTYVSGVKWKLENDQLKSFYHIKYAESENGIDWKREGIICIDFRDEKETNIARSAVVIENGIYKVWFCYVYGTTKYRIGYAESKDCKIWLRKDAEAGISVSEHDFDNEMICYPNIIIIQGKKHMFYNGNNFGEKGFGLAIENQQRT
jgi:predicted GH43/DUF377 family glycosyl hydrolase